jgi:phosphoribosylformimino-5-aminoimidazole carboxamide ribotide isomerase
MIVVPVVDLMGGLVVRARGGERDAYLPIETPLARGGDPVDVVRGLLSVYPFTTLYVADLDAIEGRVDNFAVLRRLRVAFPQLRIWADNAIADRSSLDAFLRSDVAVPVIGSESQRDVALIAACKRSEVVLSLDFAADGFRGPQELLAEPRLWPSRVIAMTMARVGTASGPDLARLVSILAVAGPRQVFAAGGVRDRADLAALTDAGAAGALMATALHEGRLTRADIEAA